MKCSFRWMACVGMALTLMQACSNAGKEALDGYEAALDSLELRYDRTVATPTMELAMRLAQEMDKANAESRIDKGQLDDDERERLSALDARREALQRRMNTLLTGKPMVIQRTRGALTDSMTTTAVYLEPGDCLYYRVETEHPSDVFIYNNDSKTILQQHRKITMLADSMPIRFAAIYVVVTDPRTRQYHSSEVAVRAGSTDRYRTPRRITQGSEDCRKTDFMARQVTGVTMEKAFDEPRKLTLRGQLKAVFSGNYRALVPIQVPEGVTDILYNLRISTNESIPEDEDDFYKGMTTSYKEVRVMGLPLYESRGGSGLLTTMLGMNLPVREEDAYINMYVFYDAKQARKFQNDAAVNTLKYNLDYSTIGTQSCNGRIPTKGRKTVYLGFENERMRYNNYVWLSALLSRPHTDYIKPVFRLAAEEETDDMMDENPM